MAFQYVIKTVVPHTMFRSEPVMLHHPELVASDATVFPADIFNELNHKGFLGHFEHQFVHMLVVGLLAYTK